PMPANNTVVVDGPDEAGKNTAVFGFGEITYSQAGIYEYEVTEIQGENAGIQYDTHKARVVVTVTDNGTGGLVASVQVTGGTFINKYTAELNYEEEGGLNLVKKLTGHNLADRQFEFKIVPGNQASADKAGIPLTGSIFKNEAAVMDENGVSTSMKQLLTGMVFTQADSGIPYTYTITEIGGSASGYTYDATIYTVSITATDDGAGKLTVTTVVSGSDGTGHTYTYPGNETATVIFENGYDATGTLGGEGAVWIVAHKTLVGRELKAGEFTFHVRNTVDNRTVSTGTNTADGTIIFDPIPYDIDSMNADVAANKATKELDSNGHYIYTYQYQIAESADLPAGVQGIATVFNIVVNVRDKGDGTLDIVVSYPGEGEGLEFKNQYGGEAEARIAVNGTKVLTVASGDNAPDITKRYTFTLTGSEGAPLPEITKTVNDGAGNVTFGEIIFTMEHLDGIETAEDGTRTAVFTYTVAESGEMPGVANDPAIEKTFTVTVTDNGDGTLLAVVNPSQSTYFTFENTYSVQEVTSSPTDASIQLRKELIGRKMREGEFSFQMLDANGIVASEGKNNGNGNIELSGITFKKPGIYQYTLIEVDEGLGGVTYDTAIYRVTAEVTDDGDGTLSVKWKSTDADGNEQDVITFKNVYSPEKTVVTLGAAKVLKGREVKAKEFTFELKDAEGNVVSNVTNDANGAVLFDELTFDTAGTYVYTVCEVKGNLDHITYDDRIYEVRITVEDSLEGYLTAVVEYDGDELVFTNVYEEVEVPNTGDRGDIFPTLVIMGLALTTMLSAMRVMVYRRH
ncbi:MAG: Spy0128 family protein, partial [Lachnospiraceae bacterium]